MVTHPVPDGPWPGSNFETASLFGSRRLTDRRAHRSCAAPRPLGTGRRCVPYHSVVKQRRPTARVMGLFRDNQRTWGLGGGRPDTSSPAVPDRAHGRVVSNGEVASRDAPRLGRNGRPWAPRIGSSIWTHAHAIAASVDAAVISPTSGSCARPRRHFPSSHAAPVCATASSSGTSRRAMAHTALTLRPPLRFTKAS